ncbi:hypothetical protein N7540_002308 [Penicillium herquei]|nr:hypothetical protein N7540_002308 [Penicillium herquei]
MDISPVEKYGPRYYRGMAYQRWIDLKITGEECPVTASQLNVGQFYGWKLFKDDEVSNPYMEFSSSPQPYDDFYEVEEEDMPQNLLDTAHNGSHTRALMHLDRMADIFNVELPNRTEFGESLPAGQFQKLDPVGSLYPPETREAQLTELLGAKNQDDRESFTISWDGIVTKGSLLINWVRRNQDQPPLHEVTNAICQHLVPNAQLRYIFLHNIVESDTRNFILDKIYDQPDNSTSPTGPNGSSFVQTFRHGRPAYIALLGTVMGKMIGRFILGRCKHGDYRLNSISVALSREGQHSDKIIDMMFDLTPTKRPNQLPNQLPWLEGTILKAPAKGTRVLEKRVPGEERPIGENRPQELNGEAAARPIVSGATTSSKQAVKKPAPEPTAPVPAPTSKAADPNAEKRAQAKKNRKLRRDEESRQAAEKQEKEDDKRYGTTRSGKRRKRN